MVTKKTTDLKPIPGWSSNQNSKAPLRDILLAQPICPYSKIRMVQTGDGRWIPDPQGSPIPNCQMAYKDSGNWWEVCESLGHDPYFRMKQFEVKEPTYEVREDGRKVKTGETTYVIEDKVPNFTRVAKTIRLNSGRGVKDKVEKFGYRLPSDIGYTNVCELSGCQKLIASNARSRTWGNYCSRQHMARVAALEQETFLALEGTGISPTRERKLRSDNQKLLRAAISDEVAF